MSLFKIETINPKSELQLFFHNPYKTDLARIMGTLDDHEEGVATLNNTQFIRLIKQIGMSIQMGGPGVTRVQASIVEPLVRLYDSDVHTKDIRIACLEVLSSMLLFQPNSQIEAKKAGLHVCILDDLEHFTVVVINLRLILKSYQSTVSIYSCFSCS